MMLKIKESTQLHKLKAVVIGSGFGGLAEAIRLQARGFEVTIIEKQDKAGGKAHQIKKDGYVFDMGPSLITAPDIIKRVFDAAGKRMEDYIDLIRLDPGYRIYFHDGTHIDYTSDSQRMKEQMRAFHPGDAENYDEFMEQTRKLYHAVITEGMGSTPFHDIKKLIQFLPRALRLSALTPAYSFVKRYFDDPRHRFTFSFHPLFIGGSPFKIPSVYLMIPYLEKTGGIWFARGGMYSLVEAFAKVFVEIGGKLKTGVPVEEIITENGKARGVRTSTSFYEADVVISNADFAHTYKDLIKSEDRKKWTDRKIDSLDYSMSAFLIYLGVKKQYPKLLHHTLILSERYKKLVTDIFDKKILPDDFSMYLHAPTRTDPSMAPDGHESLYVLIPVANLKGKIDWESEKKKYADKVIDFLEKDFGMIDLRENIEVQEIFTPVDFKEKQNAYLGSAWGVEPKLMQTAYFRPHNRSEDIKNLYFVGASTHPGAGVPGVLLTAETTENVILSDFGLQQFNLKSA